VHKLPPASGRIPHRTRCVLTLLVAVVLLGTAGAASAVVDQPGAAYLAVPVAAAAPFASATRSSSMPTAPLVEQVSRDTASAAPRTAGMAVASLRAPLPTSPAASGSHPPAPVAESPSAGYGCAAALTYLRAHAAPGFDLQCPGNAFGHQAMTCVNTAPQCPSQQVIAIRIPCPAAYMNEASNSWVLLGLRATRIDPYGYCH
jgi:hypothetical protein